MKQRPPRKTTNTVLAPQEVRIIGGKWRRSKLPVIQWPGLRPTPDRVRETLFNWLGQDLTGWRCVDAFAGTGALGFEAASRGAASVLMCEQAMQLVAGLKNLQIQFKDNVVKIQCGDGITALKALSLASVDLIFLDPPFEAELFIPALQASVPAMTPGGFIYLEAPQPWADVQLAPLGLRLYRHLRAGAVHAHLLLRLETVATLSAA